jgi:hypothetical protein
MGGSANVREAAIEVGRGITESLSPNPLFFGNASWTQACAEFDNEGVTLTPEAFQQLARGREAHLGSGVRMDPYPGGV